MSLLSPARQRTVRGHLALVGQHFRDALPVADAATTPYVVALTTP